MSQGASLGVVVLTHGRSTESVRLSRSLIDDGVEPSAIAIVQNPTTPEDPAIRPPDAAVQVIRMERNSGYAPGMNAGIRHHLERGADPILLLTHEIAFRPGSVGRMVAAAMADPRLGVVGPTLWWQGRDRPLSYGGVRRAHGGVEHLQQPPPGSNGIVPCDWADGSSLLIRREVFHRIGLMEERFFIYYEDSHFCLRARRAGWEVGVVLGAVAETAPGADSRPGAYAYLTSRNALEYERLARGARGWARQVARHVKHSRTPAGIVLRPGSDPRRRALERARLAGIWLGTLDFFRGRWGPPPPSLSGLGDVGGTEQ